jgi:hypothetical protein
MVMKKKVLKALVFLIIIGSIYYLYNKYNTYQMFGKYMLYTVGDNPFFGGSFYRRTFYPVDIESGNILFLKVMIILARLI